MKHRWAALFTVLALSALMARGVDAQGAGNPTGNQRSAGSLKQNFPNPFNPTTRIPFTLGMEGSPPVCTSPNVQYTVSLRIRDVLLNVVAIPILQGGGVRAGEPINKLMLTCGEHTAFWDGMRMGTSQQVPSGVYIYELEVDGKTTHRRMFVTK